MTRINTNVSSLNAQKSLMRATQSMNQAMARLSTGLRINAGKDDPAGLIASEALRSDIVSVQRAVVNGERANQMIATAESALGQVSSLLNDIRGLVTEAANEGAMSNDQMAANQLQIDSSLDAINRISQTTSFQGKKLIDGSLAFQTTVTSGGSTVTDLNIEQANFGSASSMSVEVDIAAGATKAQLSTAAGDTAAKAAHTVTLSESAEIQATTGGGKLRVWQNALGDNDFDVKITNTGTGTGDYDLDFTSNVLTIKMTKSSAANMSDIANDIETHIDDWGLRASGTGTATSSDTAATVNSDSSTLTFTAESAGADFNNIDIVFQGGSTNGATYSNGQITVTVDNSANQDVSDLAATLDTALDSGGAGTGWAVTSNEVGDTKFHSDTTGDTHGQDLAATGNTGSTGGNALKDSLVLQVTGSQGTEFFTFDQYARTAQVAAAINLLSDVTGVSASESDGTLTFTSVDYGSDATVDLNVVEEGASGTFESGLSGTYTDAGTDIQATVNGYQAQGSGNTLSLNVPTLQMSMTVTDGSSTDVDFTIDGGGALFQVGPDVVSNQQARIGIESVNVAELRGESGRLYQLRSGQDADLSTDPTTAAAIVDEVISQVASLRGRLGAFQKTTLESTIATLNDTLENLTGAESAIRDADFAAETSALTRAQVLVQAGVSVLAVANQNPQNVLALLR